MSFTVPDVDPATVPPGGWELHRAKDAGFRTAVADMIDELAVWEPGEADLDRLRRAFAHGGEGVQGG